jgi:hypothetical protein
MLKRTPQKQNRTKGNVTDAHALRVNHIKGSVESLLADLQTIDAGGSDDPAAMAHAHMCFELADIRSRLVAILELSNDHAVAVRLPSKNTAMEMSNLLVRALHGVDPTVT